MPQFTLTVATSSDGYIARATDDAPQTWASAEEQELFFRDVNAADWAIMGRNTHEAADKSDRRRIIFSSRETGWKRPTQFWVDPAELSVEDLVATVKDVHPFENGLILGGTRVHDWFMTRNAVDQVNLTIEPVAFGAGLPIFSDQTETDPVLAFLSRGFEIQQDQVLNDAGTRYLKMEATY